MAHLMVSRWEWDKGKGLFDVTVNTWTRKSEGTITTLGKVTAGQLAEIERKMIAFADLTGQSLQVEEDKGDGWEGWWVRVGEWIPHGSSPSEDSPLRKGKSAFDG